MSPLLRISRKRTFGIFLILLILGGVTIVRLLPHQGHLAHSVKGDYYCPMHPTYTSDRPGDCPICNMRLVKREAAAPAVPGSNEDVCLMHNCPMSHDGRPCPMMVLAKAGEKVDCPICGMHITESEQVSSNNGYVPVLLSPQKQQMIGVRTAPAQKRRLTKTIRTAGRVMADETRIVHVHPKVEGWVQEIYAKYDGDAVKKGQPLFSFYSPDFLTVQQEYLGARNGLRDVPPDASPQIRAAAQANVEAARQRLLNWDVTPEQIQSLEERNTPAKTLLLTSPIDGVVLKKRVFSGEYMERGADFYHLADLSSVWVEADLYEMDLPWVAKGQQATVILPGASVETLHGTVVYLAPTLKPETRTAMARLEFANLDGTLKPDMFATVEIGVDLGERLAVPVEAVLDTGTRHIVFVDKGKGLLDPREVSVGVKADGYIELKSGVEEGEAVVTSGNFLVDSESRLKAALQGMEGMGGMGGEGHRHGN